MTALFVLQVTVLVALGVVAVILHLTPFAESPAARATEHFLIGAAYGLTAATVLATLFSLTIN